MHWANLKARTWTKIVLLPRRPEARGIARGGAGSNGEAEKVGLAMERAQLAH